MQGVHATLRSTAYLVHHLLEPQNGLLDQFADRQVAVSTRDEDGSRVEEDLNPHLSSQPDSHFVYLASYMAIGFSLSPLRG